MLHILGHLFVTLFRVFWRIVFTVLTSALIGIGGVLLVTAAFANSNLQWPPSPLTRVLMIGVGLLFAYAGGVTVLMLEAVRALKSAAHAVEQEAVAPVRAVERELEGSKR
jgi:uncharacterized membrane protein